MDSRILIFGGRFMATALLEETDEMEVSLCFCNQCGNIVEDDDEQTEVDEEIYCQSCIEEHFTRCYSCNDLAHYDDAVGDDYTSYCQRCFENYYTRCEDCSSIINNNEANYLNDYPYCDSCYRERSDEYDDDEDGIFIHNYSYKPCPIFYGTADRFFGVELEIDKGGHDSGKADLILGVVNRDAEYIYIKSDGSLINGLEIVTHPMTLDYHMNTMRWDILLLAVQKLEYRSHDTTTCGLHIHVNRTAFGKSNEEQEAGISRVLYFIENHWKRMLTFSRRTESQMNQWAARYGYQRNPKEVMKNAKSRNLGRYTCVNITNYETIEFRMFRGTLKLNSFIAALQLVDAICEAAISLNDTQMSRLSWRRFLRSLSSDKYSELITYLKERNLYLIRDMKVNESPNAKPKKQKEVV
jgi:hypothetical protein